MKKKNELIRLYKSGGAWVAELFHNGGGLESRSGGGYGNGYFFNVHFLWYSKKDVLHLLRHKHDCIVKRGF